MQNELKEAIVKLSDRVNAHRGNICSEEATKNAFIMPFIQLMGYDVFDPCQVMPEYVADVGIKKGEKVDYAILKDGKAVMLIECKSCNTTLNIQNESQLFRYFHVSDAEFAILTNGIDYKFYTDLDQPNKMDEKPFLEFSILHPDQINYSVLAKIARKGFDASGIRQSAAHYKLVTSIRGVIEEELKQPSYDFVKLVFRKISPSGAMFTDKAKNTITPLVNSILDDTINNIVKSKLKNATELSQNESEQIAAEIEPRQDDGVVTTDAELHAYSIVKAILHGITDINRLVFRDFKSYSVVYLQRKKGKALDTVCRFHFNNPQNLRVGVFDGKEEERIAINSPDDIFGFSQRIINTVEKY